jgi:hypothetical protein
VLGAPLTMEGFVMAEVTGQRWWRARTEARRSDSDVVGFRHGKRRGWDGRVRGEARRGEGGVGKAVASSDIAANQGMAWGDTATDRRAPHISVFSY